MSRLHCQQLHAKDCLKEKQENSNILVTTSQSASNLLTLTFWTKHDCPETEPHSSWIDKIIVCSLIHRANWSTQTSNSLPLNEKSQLNDQITVIEKSQTSPISYIRTFFTSFTKRHRNPLLALPHPSNDIYPDDYILQFASIKILGYLLFFM